MTRKLNDKETDRHESQRDIWQEVLDATDEIKAGGGRQYSMMPKTAAARARHSTGLSQADFAALLGVSKRTLQQWEQGRREPSGAARMLIKIAEKHPDVLTEVEAS
jgi:putative transcriptional regulator